MSHQPSAISRVSGRGLPLRGDDIDTDRIMPARFLRAVSFDGLERHIFEDDRAADPAHPFSVPRYRGAGVLVVNANFGCGSSREHAPQGLFRFGIRAIVGESFSEIFRGNAAMIGMPCLSADPTSIERLQVLIQQAPDTTVDVDIVSGTITAGDVHVKATLPDALHEAFRSGQWNPTTMLLADFDEVRAVADRLPYIAGF
jgi:3-isopropylmalate/(R)-2-methylmalate dehydratase small subunit